MRLPYWLQRIPWGFIVFVIIILAVVWLIPLGSLNKWLADNEFIIKSVISIIVLLAPWLWQQLGRKRLRVETEPFAVIPGNDLQSIAALLFPGKPSNPNQAAQNVPYQPRRQRVTNTTQKLANLLKKKRCIIVCGPSGTGKTREILHLIQAEYAVPDWTVLVYKESWLSTPPRWPENVPHQRILIILDNLHSYCANPPQHPKASEWEGRAPVLSFQTGLHEYLSYLEKGVGEREIRVIAIARSEDEHWFELDFDSYPVWKRFTRYDLPELTDEALTQLLEDYAENLDIAVEEAMRLVKASDGMAQTVVENVNRAARHELAERRLTVENWANAADQNWQQVYEQIAARHALAPLIYDAAYLARECRLPLWVLLVTTIAVMLDRRWLLPRFWRRWQIGRALQQVGEHYWYWQAEEGRLALREGLLEGKHRLPSVDDNFEKVAQIALQIAQRHPEMAPKLIDLATAAFDRSCLDIASQTAEILLHAQDASTQWVGYGLRGNIHEEKREYEQAIADYSKAIQLYPQRETAFASRGTACIRIQDYERAIADFNEVIRLNPQYEIAYNNRGLAYASNQDYERAIADFNEVIQLNPRDALAFNNRGGVYAEKQEYKRAIADFSKAIQLDPKDVRPFYNRGLIYAKEQEYEQAIADFGEAIRLNPHDVEVFHSRGLAHAKRQEHQQAIADFNEAIRLNPHDADIFYSRGLAHAKRQEHQQAIADYSEAIRLDPQHVMAFNNRANAYIEKQEYERAIADYNEAIRLDPQHALAFLNKASAHRYLRQYREAIAAYQEALEIDPDNADYLLDLSMGARLGRLYDEALTSLNILLSKNPKSIDAHIGLAAIYKQLGNQGEYTDHLDKARKLMSAAPPYTVACLESVAGNVEAALEALVEAAKSSNFDHTWATIDPDLDEVRKDARCWEIVKRPPDR